MSDEAPGPPFSAAAIRIVEILRPHTPFAEAIVRRQSERAGLSVAALTPEDAPKIIPLVVAASHAFVDPSVIAELRALIASR
jgi:hypothetical protein